MIKFTWYGTASVLLDLDGEKILFDPFFRMNSKLEQPKLEEFCDVDYIFNTHPHFDHLCDLPKILKNTKAKFYGTPTAYLRLETQGVDVEKKVEILCPHEHIQTKNADIFIHRTRHVKNDVFLILRTAFRIIFKFKFKKALQILSAHHKFLMGGDIVAYEVRAKDKTILIFGSAGFDENANLPENVDVLIWPFQGRSNISSYSQKIISRIKPKLVILDHFDNAFPPITNNIKTQKFVNKMKSKQKLKVIVPKYKRTINLSDD